MAKSPTAERKPTVTNAIPKDRKYLTPDEAHAVINAAGRLGRYGERDKVMLRMLYRHGLRCSELCNLQWGDVNLDDGTIHIKRKKLGKNSTHSCQRDEIGALRRLWKARQGAYVFASERGGPFSNDAIQKIVRRAGEIAGLGSQIHPHKFRHAAGFALVNQGVDQRLGMEYLGHKTAAMFQHYSEVSPERLRDVRVV
jgi:integrase